MTRLDGVVRLLKTEHERLSRQIRGVSAALSAFGSAFGKAKTATVRRKISAAGRAKIADAQRRRWDKVKERSDPKADSTATTKKTTPKRTISAAGRKRIAAAQRARWAKLKGNSKTS